MFSDIFVAQLQFVFYVVICISGYTNPSRIRQPFNSCCNINPLTKQTVSVLNDVSNIDTDSKFKPFFNRKTLILLFEYSTADNFRRKKMIDKKIRSYVSGLPKFRKEFEAEPYLIYVIEAPGWEVEKIANRWGKQSFYFTDARTFFSVPYGQQLERPIYSRMGKMVNLYA